MSVVPSGWKRPSVVSVLDGEKLVVVHRRYDTIKFEVHGVDGVFGIANLQAKITGNLS